MTGRIGITCAPKSNGSYNKELYFKSVQVLETTYNSVKLSYLVNIDDSDHNKFKIQTEVNGELYNDITVDKVNRTVTINNLTPETDYDINLIASFEPYIERSRSIKIQIPLYLISGPEFNTKIKAMPNINNVTEIIFEKNSNVLDGIELAENYSQDLIKGYIDGNVLHIVSEHEITANSNCSDMFRNMPNITTITFNNFNTSEVTNLDSTFRDCPKLNSAPGLESFNTSKVKTFRRLFQDTGFTSLNLNNWDTSKVQSFSTVFGECRSLATLNISEWNTSSVNDMHSIFSYCTALASLDLSKWNTSNVTDMGAMFIGCEMLPTIDVSNWDVSKVTSMAEMFANCKKLNTINVSNWNTSNVNDMHSIFLSCHSLSAIDVSNWNTSEVTNLNRTFAECYVVKELDVSKWNTSKVTDLTRTFWDCNVVAKLDCSNWDTSNVINMDRTFCSVNEATEINVAGWNTSSCIDFHRMFANCHKVLRLDVSSFDVSKGTDLSYMFGGCNAIEDLDLTNFYTTSNKRFRGVFLGCTELITLKIPNFDFTNATGTNSMFKECPNLTGNVTINASIPETMPEGSDPLDSEYWGIKYMFENCSTNPNSKFIVKYTNDTTKTIAEKMVATKTENSNVYLDGTEPATLMAGTQFRTTLK